MFADEARFGRMNRPRPCWAPTGVRPEVAAQLIREYIYLYGAVCPKDGKCVYLIMPASDTACFQIYLDVLSRKYRRQHILLVLDGAPNHQCGLLAVPDNISLLFLPPYSPDLNPIEMIFAKLKALLRKAAERTTEALWNRITQLLEAFTPRECANCIIHAGYAPC